MIFPFQRKRNQFIGVADLIYNLGYLVPAAFSMRRLTTRYTGPCLRVRRDSDNAEKDINFDFTNWIDRSSVSDFCNGANGLISKWYDQSGNGTDASQSSASLQPTLFASGAISTWGASGESPAYRCNMVSSGLLSFDDSNLPSGINSSTTLCVSLVNEGSGVRNRWGYGGTAASSGRHLQQTNGVIPRLSNNTAVIATTTSATGVKTLTTGIFTGASTLSVRSYYATAASLETASINTATTNTTLGGATGGLIWAAPSLGSSSSHTGNFSELIHVAGAIPAGGLECIERNIMYFYNFN